MAEGSEKTTNVTEVKEAPVLTFGDGIETKESPAVQMPDASQLKNEKPLDDSMLSDAERKQVDDFAQKIDLSNSQAILQYGVGTQKKMSDFSEKAVENVKTKDMGEVGDLIAGLPDQARQARALRTHHDHQGTVQQVGLGQGDVCIGIKVVGKHVHIGIAGVAPLGLYAGHLTLDLRFNLVCNKVNGGIHVRSLFRGIDVQAFTGNGHFAAMAKLVYGKHNCHFQARGLAKKPSQLFHAATGILLQVFGGFKVLECK